MSVTTLHVAMKIRIALILAFFVSLARAQGCYDNYGEERNQGYQGYDYNDNQEVFVRKSDGLSWPKLVAASIGGFVVGVATTLRKNKKGKRNGGGRSTAAPVLRFKINQRVKCNMGNEWSTGTVVKLWHLISPGSWMPYQIALDNGSTIWAPTDNDDVIRALKR